MAVTSADRPWSARNAEVLSIRIIVFNPFNNLRKRGPTGRKCQNGILTQIWPPLSLNLGGGMGQVGEGLALQGTSGVSG